MDYDVFWLMICFLLNKRSKLLEIFRQVFILDIVSASRSELSANGKIVSRGSRVIVPAALTFLEESNGDTFSEPTNFLQQLDSFLKETKNCNANDPVQNNLIQMTWAALITRRAVYVFQLYGYANLVIAQKLLSKQATAGLRKKYSISE